MLTEDEEREFQQSKGDIAELVSSLKYYCDYNGNSDLFMAILRLCDSMHTEGAYDNMWLLYDWAREMAEQSYIYAKDTYSNGDDSYDWEDDYYSYDWS